MAFFDDLETRSSDQRSTENAALLKDILNLAVNLDGYKVAFGSFDLSKFKSLENLPSLPVLRKSELSEKQVKGNLFGGYSAKKPFTFAHIFNPQGQSTNLVVLVTIGGALVGFYMLLILEMAILCTIALATI